MVICKCFLLTEMVKTLLKQIAKASRATVGNRTFTSKKVAVVVVVFVSDVCTAFIRAYHLLHVNTLLSATLS